MLSEGIEQAFRSGELLLPVEPSAPLETVPASGVPVAVTVMMALFVVAAILLLRNFLQILPLLADSIFRARGSTSLESSVRSSGDRNLIALVLTIPMILLAYRYRLYDPDFVQGMGDSARLLCVGGAIAAWILLRAILYVWFKPKRRYDFYQLSYRSGFTYWILLSIVMLLTSGILFLFGTPDRMIRIVLYAEIFTGFSVYLFRRAQILSLSCNHLRTFLYLCGLEILPAAALVISAVIL